MVSLHLNVKCNLRKNQAKSAKIEKKQSFHDMILKKCVYLRQPLAIRGLQNHIFMLGKDITATCVILPALEIGAGKSMPEKWQMSREFFSAGFLLCKWTSNFSAPPFCRANEPRIIPRWLFAMQNDREFFSAAFLPCKWTGNFPALHFCNGNVKTISAHDGFATQNDSKSLCIAFL